MEVISANKYLSLLHSMKNFVAMLDIDGRLEFMNRTSSGYTEKDIKGEFLWESSWFNRSEESKEKVKEAVGKALHDEWTDLRSLLSRRMERLSL